jgi:MFS family permease
MNVVVEETSDRFLSPALATLCMVSFLAGVAMGLFNPLISTLMAQHHISDVLIGANSTLFFLFVLLAAPCSTYLQRHLGARATMASGLLLSAASAVQIPLYNDLFAWFALRAAMGVGVGLYMISGQTALNQLAHESRRAVLNGCHALAFGVGLGSGPLVGAALYEVSPILAFAVGAGLMLLGLPGVLAFLPLLRSTTPRFQSSLLRTLSVPLHGVFAYGVAEATLMSLYPVFLLRQGYSVGQIGLAFSVFVAGGILSTLPLTRLADRSGCERVLFGCALIGVLSTTVLVQAKSILLVTVLSFVAGASLGPVFAVSLALLAQLLPRDQMPAGSALFTTAFSLGSMIAPMSVALIMQYFGRGHIFSLAMALFAVLSLRLLGQSSNWWTNQS